MSGGHGEKAGRLRERAVVALLVEPTVKRAAQRARVSYRQLREWMKSDQDFRRAYQQARRQYLEAALARLQRDVEAARRTLRKNLKAEKSGDQIRAAVAIVTFGVQGSDLLDIRERLEAVEERLLGMEDPERGNQR
jgi:hypothetical protein